MSNKKRTRLTDLDLSMVSLVPAGDDPLAKAVLFKAANSKNNEANQEATTLSDQADKENSQVTTSDTIRKDDLPDEVVAYIEALEEEVTENESVIKTYEALVLKDDDFDDDGEDEDEDEDDYEDDGEIDAIVKSNPALADYIAKMERTNAEYEERIAKAERTAEAERSERLRRDYVAKAAGLPAINATADELGLLLKELNDLSPKHAEKVEKLLAAANEQIAKSDLFREVGRAGTGVTVSASVEGAAKAIQKAYPNMTYEQAIAKAYDDNPALYEESLQD